jgi:hypothetical protein
MPTPLQKRSSTCFAVLPGAGRLARTAVNDYRTGDQNHGVTGGTLP